MLTLSQSGLSNCPSLLFKSFIGIPFHLEQNPNSWPGSTGPTYLDWCYSYHFPHYSLWSCHSDLLSDPLIHWVLSHFRALSIIFPLPGRFFFALSHNWLPIFQTSAQTSFPPRDIPWPSTLKNYSLLHVTTLPHHHIVFPSQNLPLLNIIVTCLLSVFPSRM